jgi:hypothetical protein
VLRDTVNPGNRSSRQAIPTISASVTRRVVLVMAILLLFWVRPRFKALLSGTSAALTPRPKSFKEANDQKFRFLGNDPLRSPFI